MFWRCARLISDENTHVCKHESKAYMKAKHTNKQKSYVFSDQMYIFSKNGSHAGSVNVKISVKRTTDDFENICDWFLDDFENICEWFLDNELIIYFGNKVSLCFLLPNLK